MHCRVAARRGPACIVVGARGQQGDHEQCFVLKGRSSFISRFKHTQPQQDFISFRDLLDLGPIRSPITLDLTFHSPPHLPTPNELNLVILPPRIKHVSIRCFVDATDMGVNKKCSSDVDATSATFTRDGLIICDAKTMPT